MILVEKVPILVNLAARPTGGASFPPTKIHPLAGRTILQIIPELEAGGAERTAVDIAAALARAGARALVATEGGRLVGELQAKGGIWAPFPAGTKNPLAMLLERAPPRQALPRRGRRSPPCPLARPGLGRATAPRGR